MIRRTSRLIMYAAAAGVLVYNFSPAYAEPVGSLKGIEAPLPDLTGIVRSEKFAILLGKALFWDMQAGSDGQSCASCHFQAGAAIFRIDAAWVPMPTQSAAVVSHSVV